MTRFLDSPVRAVNRTPRSRLFNVYFVVLLSAALLSANFYLLGLSPLLSYLQTIHVDSIELSLQNSAGRVESIITNQQAIAKQVASRSAIRQKQAAYLRGEISQEELAGFSRKKLSDAVAADELILSIVRYDPDGNRLFSVGIPLLRSFAQACQPASLSTVTLLPPTQAKMPGQLIYCSPIFAERDARIGFDLIAFSDRPIQTFLNEQSTPLQQLALLSPDKDRLYTAETPNTDTLRRMLLRHIHEADFAQDTYDIYQLPIAESGWLLFGIVDANAFMAPIKHQTQALLFMLVLATAAIILLTTLVLRPILDALRREEHLKVLAHRDRLTGLFNHGHIQEILDTELERAKRYSRPIAVLLFDIDHFKRINDGHGHQAGDLVLKQLAERSKQSLRTTDQLARYGGEEFLAVLPETDAQQGQLLAERLRGAIAEAPFVYDGQPLHITISAGVASWEAGDGPAPTKIELVRSADRALYRAKAHGRNQVHLAGGDLPTPNVVDFRPPV